jgi:hypothetical protein
VQYQEQQDESDSSISDYMNRLLGRAAGNDEAQSSGGESGTGPHASASEDAPPSEIAAPSPETETKGAAAPPTPEPSNVPTQNAEEEYAPRNSVPERASHLAAMRELANVSARNAIQTCDKKRSAKGVLGRIPLLLLELGFGGLLLYWAVRSGQAIAYVAVVVCFIAAAITGVHTLWFLAKTALAAMRMPTLRESTESS